MADTQDAVAEPAPGGPPANDPLPGMQLGDYVVEKAVAWGGMGIVYRAVHPLIGRKVAIKVLRPSFAADPQQMSRFLAEAKAVSAIKHRGIIDIIGFGKLPDGRQYMVMEFLDGETLEAVMQREGALPPARALSILEELLDALSAAHKVGVVHRDLKPANVYIALQSNGSRYVKLVDFGLARRASVADLNRGSGKASVMAGTPEYFSPEQARGLAATPRTDLYCLGVMLFEMVTGQLPFRGDSVVELLSAHLSQVAPRASSVVSSIPEAVDDLIAQMLEKSADDRPPSADVVRQTVLRIGRKLQEERTAIRVVAPPGEVEKPRLAQPASDTDRVGDRPITATSLMAATPLTLSSGARSTWRVVAASGLACALVAGGWAALRSTPPQVIELPPDSRHVPVELPGPVELARPVELAKPVEPPRVDPSLPTIPATADSPPVQKKPPVRSARPAGPTGCEGTGDWKPAQNSALGKVEQAFYKIDTTRAARQAADQEIDRLHAKISSGKSSSDCEEVARGLATFKSHHGL